MRCTICGKEFGEGIICQNCGVDRVTGLANPHGYQTPSRKGSILPSSENANGTTTPSEPPFVGNVVEEKTMFCYACNEVIPADSDFCPVCGQKLYVMCPSCGSRYSSKFEICNKCGTNRVQFEQQRLERERIAKEERLRKEKEQKIREEKKREEERRIAEKQRQKEEKERREREKREKEQKELEDRAYNIIRGIRGEIINIGSWTSYLTFVIIFILFTALSIYLTIAVSGRFIVLVILIIPFMIGYWEILEYFEKQDFKEKIQKYIKDHPNDPVNQYLKKEIE